MEDGQLVDIVNRAEAARNGQPMRARVPAARRPAPQPARQLGPLPAAIFGPEREDDAAQADVLEDAIIIAPEHLARVRAMAARPR